MPTGVFAILAVLALPAALGAAPANPVKAQLLADVSAIQPNRPFTLGVLLTIQDGWHIYWQNPGDAGLATAVKFLLPAGWEIGPLNWPTPQKFTEPGDIVTFGYSQSVLLTARVTPHGIVGAQRASLSAKVEWLACQEACTPGLAQLALDLPVASAPAPDNQVLFEAWSKHLPTWASDPGSPAVATVSGRLEDGAAGSVFTITLNWKQRPPAQVDFFPAADPSLSIQNVATQTSPTQARIAFSITRLAGTRPPPQVLYVVIGYDAASGRQGILVPVSLNPPATRPE